MNEIQQNMDSINETLNHITAIIDGMNKKLDMIMGEIDKDDKNESRKNITTTYDVNVVYGIKNK